MADRHELIGMLLSLLSSLIEFLQLRIAIFNLQRIAIRQRRNVMRYLLFSNPLHFTSRRFKPYRPQRRFWVRPGRTSAWWDNFVDEMVIAEEWPHNLRMLKHEFCRF